MILFNNNFTDKFELIHQDDYFQKAESFDMIKDPA